MAQVMVAQTCHSTSCAFDHQLDSKLERGAPIPGGTDGQEGERSPSRLVTSAVEPRVDGEVSSVVPVLQEVAVVAEAVGEGRSSRARRLGSNEMSALLDRSKPAVPCSWCPAGLLSGYPVSIWSCAMAELGGPWEFERASMPWRQRSSRRCGRPSWR